jgi:CDP-glycerol glycerophosphotransferase (TagB/SpsB family)
VSAVWLVLPDPFSSRLFFDTGIVERLRTRFGDRLELFLLDTGEQSAAWAKRAGTTRVTTAADLRDHASAAAAKAHRRADAWLDRRIGFYPLSLRHSLRHGFHRQRMRAGHSNWFLDPTLAGPLPRWYGFDPLMSRWHYGPLRYVPRPVLERARRERPSIALANMQMHAVQPFVVAARRFDLPVVGNIASWDHTVGKGIVAPGLARYLVQNEAMRNDLVRYHGIDGRRIAVTGWPQTDVFHRTRARDEYEALLRAVGLDTERPLVVVMGNTPTNAPYEANLVERIVGWWREAAQDRISLLFRPHPRDREWDARFAAARDVAGIAVQEPSFTDLETLAVLLQHCDAVVTNAGTILLDALANDRPAVCVLWDEGAPEGEQWAVKNVSGDHYRALFESSAFYRATQFSELVDGIERALAEPEELAEPRAAVTRVVLGEVDGRAAERVADEIASALPNEQRA